MKEAIGVIEYSKKLVRTWREGNTPKIQENVSRQKILMYLLKKHVEWCIPYRSTEFSLLNFQRIIIAIGVKVPVIHVFSRPMSSAC